MNTLTDIRNVAVNVSDQEVALRFYTDTLGFATHVDGDTPPDAGSSSPRPMPTSPSHSSPTPTPPGPTPASASALSTPPSRTAPSPNTE